MIKLLPKRRITSVLGLSLDAGRLDGVVVRRTNGSVIVLKAFSAALTLDPLTNEPELLGQEIRNILDKAGIRERRCAVCVPLSWALTHQTKVPDLPEADLQDLLSLEAERGFPYGPESLLISKTIAKVPGGEQYVTQIAVQRDHVVRLERALKAARLKPVTMSLGLSALQPPELPEGVLALLPLETSVALQVSYGGGVIALRSLEGAVEAEAGLKQIHGDAVAREIRITLGQMPAELR
ncbi:MAG: type pilus assembly protein PilM, partial [Verrucomicrobiales bacterium]|nr:type pilus assembly protein PilM [Verrucomicrobiales bacterium]